MDEAVIFYNPESTTAKKKNKLGCYQHMHMSVFLSVFVLDLA